MGGRAGGSGSGFGSRSSVGDESMRGMSAKLKKVLKEREDLIRMNNMFEMGTVYDEKGNVIFQNNRGEKSSVWLGNDYENRIVTHNHPGEKKEGQALSLSPDDMFLAASHNAKEMRAVTEHYTYSLRRPKKGWGVDSKNGGMVKDSSGKWVDNSSVKRMKKVYSDSFMHVTSKLDHYADHYKGGSDAAWKRATVVVQHLVNKEFAKRMGWEYTKTRVDNATLLKFGGKPWRSTKTK
jgi:hypothetical protein